MVCVSWCVFDFMSTFTVNQTINIFSRLDSEINADHYENIDYFVNKGNCELWSSATINQAVTFTPLLSWRCRTPCTGVSVPEVGWQQGQIDTVSQHDRLLRPLDPAARFPGMFPSRSAISALWIQGNSPSEFTADKLKAGHVTRSFHFIQKTHKLQASESRRILQMCLCCNNSVFQSIL